MIYIIKYPVCSRKSCELYYEEICSLCLGRNDYQCDVCNTEEIQELEGCKCEVSC